MLTGVSATEHHNNPGGGSNLLCLNLNISYTEGNYVDGFQGDSYVYSYHFIITQNVQFRLRLLFTCKSYHKVFHKTFSCLCANLRHRNRRAVSTLLTSPNKL